MLNYSHVFKFSKTALRSVFGKTLRLQVNHLNFGKICRHEIKEDKIYTTCASVVNLQFEKLIWGRTSFCFHI